MRTGWIAGAALGAVLGPVAARADTAPAEPPELAAVAPAPTERAPVGASVGVEFGQPTALAAGWATMDGLVGVRAALGRGTWGPGGWTGRLEAVTAPVVWRTGDVAVVAHAGLGLNWVSHSTAAATIDEAADRHLGVRASLGGGVLIDPGVEVYLEVAPGFDTYRSESCTLASGLDSLCPHTDDGRAYLDAVVGARWFVGG